MNKIILKTALITVAALAVIAAAVFSLWLVCSPSTMAGACERTGNYPLAITCADLSYKYSNDIGDLARCAENSVRAGDDRLIALYGEKLIVDESFEELCSEKDKLISGSDYAQYTSAYKTYICGHVAAAEYRSGKLEKAIEAARKGGVHAFTKLVLQIAETNDKSAAESVIFALEELQDSEKLIEILKKI